MKKTSKTILITGASSGFGRDMAGTLAADAHKGGQSKTGPRLQPAPRIDGDHRPFFDSRSGLSMRRKHWSDTLLA
jgi:hypothetical protein